MDKGSMLIKHAWFDKIRIYGIGLGFGFTRRIEYLRIRSHRLRTGEEVVDVVEVAEVVEVVVP